MAKVIYFRGRSLDLAQGSDLQESTKWGTAYRAVIGLIPQTVGA